MLKNQRVPDNITYFTNAVIISFSTRNARRSGKYYQTCNLFAILAVNSSKIQN